jgi:Calcineurin-like phosphoesterase
VRHRTRLAVAALLAVLDLATRAPGAAGAAASCAIDGVERVVAIGDVHGAYDRFVDILKASALIDAQLKWSGGATHLVQLGDVVDRGPDSRRALDLLQRLQKEATRAGGRVHPLLGNHEAARMLGDMRFATPGEYGAFETDRSADVRESYVRTAPAASREQLLRDTPLGFVELRMAFGRSGEYGKWLRTLDTTVRINGVVFVHGGISPATAALTCDDINATVRRDLGPDLDKSRAAPLTTLTAREDGPLWYRGLMQLAESEVDAILAKQHARAIVVGHTVEQTGRIALRFGGKVIAIDTGMQPAYVQGGRASALEWRGDTITAIYTDSRDVLR